MAKVFVTGAGGKIGSSLMRELVAKGHRPIGLFRSRRGQDDGVEWHHGDIARPETYAAALAGCEAVLHLAVSFKPEEMDRINVDATRSLLEASQAAGIRYFGLASSIVVYGSPPQPLVTEQTDVIDLASPIGMQYLADPVLHDYARSKVSAESAAALYALAMTVDLYRPTVVVDLDQVLQIGEWGLARKASNAPRRTQYVMTTDVSAAIVHVMERGLIGPPRGRVEAWNIADPVTVTYRELMKRAYAQTGDSRFRLPFGVPALIDRVRDAVRYRTLGNHVSLGRLDVSTDKLRATGFKPSMGMDEAITLAISEWGGRPSGG